MVGWGTFFALLARIAILSKDPSLVTSDTIFLYFFINVFEKPLIIIGLLKFLSKKIYYRSILILTTLVQLYLISIWYFELSVWYFRSVIAPLYMMTFLWISYQCYINRDLLPGRFMGYASICSGLFAIHWGSAFLVLNYFPQWKYLGFIAGTILNLGLYSFMFFGGLLCFKNRLEKAESKALHLAYFDSLTGLRNRAYIWNTFDLIKNESSRSGKSFAIIFIDLDDFKPINDTFGHCIGDAVLKEVAHRIEMNTRGSDICCRLGGDEFVVIATQIKGHDDAVKIVKKLISEIQRTLIIDINTFQISFSAGLAIYPEHGNELEALIKHADKAMYDVKSKGESKDGLYKVS